MKVVSTFHAPSSVAASVKCSLTPDAEHLVVAKTNRLEVFSLQPEGLKLECTHEFWGRVISVKAFPKDVRSALHHACSSGLPAVDRIPNPIS